MTGSVGSIGGSMVGGSLRGVDNKSPSPLIMPTQMYKLLVPLLRCEVQEMRDSVVMALGRINHGAIMDLMIELVGYIKEAIDRKHERTARKRRRDGRNNFHTKSASIAVCLSVIH